MGVWIVQGNGRDHGGEVFLVTTDETRAKEKARDLIVEWNPAYPEWMTPADVAFHEGIARDAGTMDVDAFLARYVSAWVDAASIEYHDVVD